MATANKTTGAQSGGPNTLPIQSPGATHFAEFGRYALMNLYEVIFWGSYGKTQGDEDTIYLVRAPDFMAAVEEVRNNASRSNHGGERGPLAHIVYEVGVDSSAYATATGPRILRGPYFQCAYNYAWRSWERNVEGAENTQDWKEKSSVAAEPAPFPNGGPATPVASSEVAEGPPSVS